MYVYHRMSIRQINKLRETSNKTISRGPYLIKVKKSQFHQTGFL